MKKWIIALLIIVSSQHAIVAQKYFDDWLLPPNYNSDCGVDLKDFISHKFQYTDKTKVYRFNIVGSISAFVDLMVSYYAEDTVKIKGIASLLDIRHLPVGDSLYALGGIMTNDSNNQFNIVTQQKILLTTPFNEFFRTYVEVLFDSVISVVDSFYVFIDCPKPTKDTSENIYNWDYSKKYNENIPNIGHWGVFSLDYNSAINLCNLEPVCKYDPKCLFRYHLVDKTGRNWIIDSVWHVAECFIKSSKDPYVSGVVLTGHELYFYTPAIFPIMWNGPTYDTVIKGGQTIEGDFVTTEKTLLTGDTTIVEYTTIKCDTVMAPDTLILADNKLDTVLSGDVSDIVCDTTVTYDTTINSLISTVIENATNIFPNPAKDELNIQSAFRISEVELINPQGQIIESKQINDYKTTINVKNYPKGTYILNVKTKSGAFQKKVLIQ